MKKDEKQYANRFSQSLTLTLYRNKSDKQLMSLQSRPSEAFNAHGAVSTSCIRN